MTGIALSITKDLGHCINGNHTIASWAQSMVFAARDKVLGESRIKREKSLDVMLMSSLNMNDHEKRRERHGMVRAGHILVLAPEVPVNAKVEGPMMAEPHVKSNVCKDSGCKRTESS